MMRLAIVGCGLIGTLRGRAAARVSGARVTVACDADPARARALAASLRCAAETEWPRAVARDDVDAVVISTSNDAHLPIALGAAEAGKHILCEKPLARTPAECRQMVDAAAARGVVLMTGFNHRRYPPVATAKRLIEAGAIGTPLSFRGWIGHEAGQAFLQSWMANPAMSGGGTLLDNGVHLLDLVRHLLGEITDVQGYTATSHWPAGSAEDQALAILRTASGALAVTMSSWTQWQGYQWKVHVSGSHGAVTAQYPPMLAVLDRRTNGRSRRRYFPFVRQQVLERLRSYRWSVIESFREEFMELASAVRERRAASPDGVDGLRAVAVAHAIYESARQGTRVSVAV